MRKKFDPKIQEITPGPAYALSVSLEYEEDPEEACPMLLFVPDETKPEHFHIPLDREEAEKLYYWLRDFLDGGL